MNEMFLKLKSVACTLYPEIVVQRFEDLREQAVKGILFYCISVEERYNPLLKKNEICSTESCTSSTRREDS